MKFLQTELSGVIIVEPDVYRDERGFFLETFHAEKYRQGGIEAVFVQDNHSRSLRNTLRGLHAQRHFPQGKLVRVIEGEIFDVAVDLWRPSATFGQWVGVVLSAENFRQVYIPPGFAHGFCVTSEWAQVEYKCTSFYNPTDELGIRWNDPELAIAWPVHHPVLSPKDRSNPCLSEIIQTLPTW